MKKYIFIFVLFSILFTSCTKVIDLKLKSSETRFVLKGLVTAGDTVHTLSITTTVPFNQGEVFPTVSGANVTLSDNLGNSTALLDNGNGIYKTVNYMAYEGRTYTLKVVIGDKNFESKTTIPLKAPLLGLEYLESGSEGKLIIPQYQDPEGVNNFYKFRYFQKNVLSNDSEEIISSDEFYDGELNTQPYFNVYAPFSGDTVIFSMSGIDESVYTFFFSMETNVNTGGGPLGSAPANPIGNWSNKALGYFSAENFQEIEVVIP